MLFEYVKEKCIFNLLFILIYKNIVYFIIESFKVKRINFLVLGFKILRYNVVIKYLIFIV